MRIVLCLVGLLTVTHAAHLRSKREEGNATLQQLQQLQQLKDNLDAAVAKLTQHEKKVADKESELKAASGQYTEAEKRKAKDEYEAAKAIVDAFQQNITSIDEELKKAETAQDARKTELNTTLEQNNAFKKSVDDAEAVYQDALKAAYAAKSGGEKDEEKVKQLKGKEEDAEKAKNAAVAAKNDSDEKVTQAQQAVVTADQLHQNLTIGRVFLEAQKGIAETEANTKKTISEKANQPVDEKHVAKVKNELEQMRTELVEVQKEKETAEKLYNEANKKPDNGIPANFALIPFVMVLMALW